MRPYLIFALVMFALAATLVVMSAQTQSTNDYPQPPESLRGDATVLVRFVDPEQLPAICKSYGATVIAAACTVNRQLVVLPNPCVRYHDTKYGQLACHELGHVNGWPADHGSSSPPR